MAARWADGGDLVVATVDPDEYDVAAPCGLWATSPPISLNATSSGAPRWRGRVCRSGGRTDRPKRDSLPFWEQPTRSNSRGGVVGLCPSELGLSELGLGELGLSELVHLRPGGRIEEPEVQLLGRCHGLLLESLRMVLVARRTPPEQYRGVSLLGQTHERSGAHRL